MRVPTIEQRRDGAMENELELREIINGSLELSLCFLLSNTLSFLKISSQPKAEYILQASMLRYNMHGY